jgi:hypothetical protein
VELEPGLSVLSFVTALRRFFRNPWDAELERARERETTMQEDNFILSVVEREENTGVEMKDSPQIVPAIILKNV